ncbi:non-homologous end-joining DNA ligase LigD [Amycolatopsis sp. CA-230715]|uniref:non-homologous end-joining DNA ligase LigD n=1 Tax=Amycolatopsis sp. CA-230715 TaxID=2745196 RepID=UPI003FA48B0A
MQTGAAKRRAHRPGTALVDTTRNRSRATSVAAYSVRGHTVPHVATGNAVLDASQPGQTARDIEISEFDEIVDSPGR